MRVIRIFDIYFLILMISEGCILIFFDVATFNRKGEVKLAKKARKLGVCMMAISILLYLLQKSL